mgnify:CR=1 FL=1
MHNKLYNIHIKKKAILKMNAVIALCIFCESHGPKVIFTTQTYRNYDNQGTERLKFYGPKEILRRSQSVMEDGQHECEGCQSIGNVKYLSNEHETRTSFLSAQQSLTQDIWCLLKHACFRYNNHKLFPCIVLFIYYAYLIISVSIL